MISREYILSGCVQGVGFRPFVHNLAHTLNLTGWVLNQNGCVSVRVEGNAGNVALFEKKIISEAPPLAKPCITARFEKKAMQFSRFEIKQSQTNSNQRTASVQLPADLYCCPECEAELFDTSNFRYQYPFINCTQCGPRYTLIDALPYDRRATSMHTFTLCAACDKEYRNPNDRRFHAEPIACHTCGPQLEYIQGNNATREHTLDKVCHAIANGKIIAIKGIGGFHLLCDATNNDAVARLRERKSRPHKPLAIMLLPEQLTHYAILTPRHREQLFSPVRPVVLCPSRARTNLAKELAPGLNELGIILPYSPLHSMLMQQWQKPLVVTSANISGEPVFTEAEDIIERMPHIVDGILNHNRPIRRPADDSVIHIHNDAAHTLRIGRGIAPLELRSPFSLPDATTVLATGAQSKNTLCLAFGDRLIVSPHIADMENLRSQSVFEQLCGDFTSLYQHHPTCLAHDVHPEFSTSRWAKKQGLPCYAILHHHAHASSLYAQTGNDDLLAQQDILAFTWDGVGMGDNSELWGGECFSGRPGHWLRQIHFAPIKLPGGDKAVREPWRIGESLRLHCGLPYTRNDTMLPTLWQRSNYSPASTAVGRLLDGCAALLGLCDTVSFEGQAPMLLAALAMQNDSAHFIELPIKNNEVRWQPLVHWLIHNLQHQAFAARVVHNSLAHSLVEQARQLHKKTQLKRVGISGGVFQNSLLVDTITEQLPKYDLHLHHPQHIPVNDGGLCIGQAIETAARIADKQFTTN